MASDVFLMDLNSGPKENILQKLDRFMKKAGLQDVVSKNDFTAVKIHFGEKGNIAYIQPVCIRQITRTIKEANGIPFLTDSNTLYKGTRSNAVSHIKIAVENGFSYASMEVPIIIADGLMGKMEIPVQVNLKHFKEVYIGSEIVHADALVSVAHFKGHELSGFGGTLKNLGMGSASRRGKLAQHSSVNPKIKRKTCIGCGECARHCPGSAILIEDGKAYIKKRENCIGCAECIIRCPTGSVKINWNQTVPVFMERMMEYSMGSLKNKQKKALFINFINKISPKCDCLPFNEFPIVNDIGVVFSQDPVAIDQASADLVNQQPGNHSSKLQSNFAPGEDKFKALYPEVDWEHQLDYAQSIGLGSRKYNLIRIDTLS